VSASGLADERARGEGLAAVLGGLLFLLVGLPLAVFPFAAPVAGAALALGGVAGRRRSHRPLVRGLALGALVAGILLVLVGLFLALGYATGRGTGVDSGTS
jgi:hypothetical protein